ncbi:MAG: stealth conserved region 3 domain-containing protein [Candidatus Nanopelagicales bacterium]|nr:stealth conserved region 3 domain-containing protein [Candidatus Nanopelagicales bacterium]
MPVLTRLARRVGLIPKPEPAPPPPPPPERRARALPHELSLEHRERVISLLSEWGVATFPVAGFQPTRVRVGVIASSELWRLFAETELGDGTWWIRQDRRACRIGGPAWFDRLEPQRVMQVYRMVEHVSGGRPIAEAGAVEVNLWRPDPMGGISTDSSNPVTMWLPEGVAVGCLDAPVPRSDQTADPVDVVITWVTDADETWRADFQRIAEESTGDPGLLPFALTPGRFRDSGELRYALRGIEANLPWVRMIHVVSGNRRPEWLADHPKIRFVHHSEILPTAALPTFNSHAIEAALHRIPGLAEQFVYFNDDVFACNPLGTDRFFGPTGHPVIYLSRKPIGLPGHPLDTAPAMAADNARRILRSWYGREIDRTLLHVAHAMRRSYLDDLWRRAPEELGRTEHARVRRNTDIPPILLHHWDSLLRGAAAPSKATCRVIDVGDPSSARALADLRSAKYMTDFVTLNQRDDARAEDVAQLVSAMEWIHPFPSSFEADSGA